MQKRFQVTVADQRAIFEIVGGVVLREVPLKVNGGGKLRTVPAGSSTRQPVGAVPGAAAINVRSQPASHSLPHCAGGFYCATYRRDMRPNRSPWAEGLYSSF
jgi:hypothetical protein